MSAPPQTDPRAAEDDGFSAPVTHKRAPKHRKGKNRPRERTLEERVASRLGALDKSGFLQACAVVVEKAFDSGCARPQELVCLGLGSVADSTKSQDQFHLLQTLDALLRKDLKGKGTVFDPVFSPEDIEYFSQNGFTPLTAEHPLTLDVPTLLYMPHCPRSLFDLLLQRNWTRERLGRLVLLGNRLDMYDDPTHPSSQSREKSPFIARAAPLFEIVALPGDKRHVESFNDLAVQWIPVGRLEERGEEFWKAGEGEPRGEERSLEGALNALTI